jgi:hypothetical protein
MESFIKSSLVLLIETQYTDVTISISPNNFCSNRRKQSVQKDFSFSYSVEIEIQQRKISHNYLNNVSNIQSNVINIYLRSYLTFSSCLAIWI